MPVGIYPVGFFPAPEESAAVSAACCVGASAVVAATMSELAALRDEPGGGDAPPIPPRFLRHADEQTVVGLAAVLRAMRSPALHGVCYDDWGVVAAPVFPGRLGSAGTFTKYRENGAAVVSPHIIPQYALHSVAGAVSICLGIHGLNFGIGGGWQALAEGLTVALSLLDRATLPGLWLVLTQWTPEPVPDGFGSTQSASICSGTALALRPGNGSGTELRMTLPGSRHTPERFSAAVAGPDATSAWPATGPGHAAYHELTRALTADPPAGSPIPWSLTLPWGGRVDLVRTQHQQQTKAA